MNLVIDIGNTKTKVAVFSQETVISLEAFEELTTERLSLLLKKHETIRAGILSAVRDYPESIDLLLQKLPFFLKMDSQTPVPLIKRYASPETLGNDRLALAVAASKQFPGQNVLVIGVGTTLTYDVVNSNNEYLGGAIAPGIFMRFKSLHAFTGKLPLITEFSETPPIGTSTKECLISGVLNGIKAEVAGMIGLFASELNNLRIILTGGDAKYFDKIVKMKTFTASNLVLNGLNHILNYSLEEK